MDKMQHVSRYQPPAHHPVCIIIDRFHISFHRKFKKEEWKVDARFDGKGQRSPEPWIDLKKLWLTISGIYFEFDMRDADPFERPQEMPGYIRQIIPLHTYTQRAGPPRYRVRAQTFIYK